ncbi:restriction endonuclease [Aeromonas allosaccharophila]|uniref:restriction endonuclease n=1 Tax=Aeromonas allosaccharophila TaxID=656 RepID=UPI003D1AEAF6
MADLPVTLTNIDFIQDRLDFSKISPTDFENLIFHLLDEMGFSNIVWRKGGEGNSATDGGRDLEATFWTVLPTVSKEQSFWFEVKHRGHHLEKIQVQKTILNSAGDSSVDNIVIVTNKTISNPTLDWVKQYQKAHKSPKILIWQGHDLELFLRRNPLTLAKFIPTSLAFSGRCKVTESKFSNFMMLPAGRELDELWDNRSKYHNNSYLTLISILAEVAHGNINTHQWGMDIDDSRLISVAIVGMLNIYPLMLKFKTFSRDCTPLISGLSYIIQCLLLRCGEKITAKILFNPEEFSESTTSLPCELTFYRYEPIFNTLFYDLSIECSKDYCPKVKHIHKGNKNTYFNRFMTPSEENKDETYYILNSQHFECELGLLDKDEYCPLGDTEHAPETFEGLLKKLAFARNVISSRIAGFNNHY